MLSILKNKLIVLMLFCVIAINGYSQTACIGLGQNPGAAFPVCSADTIIQDAVPACGGKAIPGPCSVDGITDINPYWYKFICFSGGTLGFTITPENAGDDYNWQLFDVTPYNPALVYSDPGIFVACNWSSQRGITGASSAGASLTNCRGAAVPLFSKMPALIKGHGYLLLISHFSGDSQSGFMLTFPEGTASILDRDEPHFSSSAASCDGTKISVKLNKKMKCSSVDADGSDFILSPAVAPIISAAGAGCSGNSETDSIELILGSPLPPGNYKITARLFNNLQDGCNNFIPSADTLAVTVFPPAPTPMDSISKVGCAPEVLQLVFRDLMRCSSIKADGSDFVVTGTAPVRVIGATGICNANGLTNVINVQLSAPIRQAGNFSLQLKTGTDGNTIVNECGKETPAGAFLQFNTKDTVSALFKTTVEYGCFTDKILYSHDGRNGVNSWEWIFDNRIGGTAKDTTVSYAVFGKKQAELIVTNGTCSDTATASIDLNNSLKASFEGTATICPGDPVTFINNSTSSFNLSWFWNFGNGNISRAQHPPPQFYAPSNNTHDVPVQLIITNSIGCSDTANNTISVLGNCFIGIPKAFSPNGDGLNDYLYPTNGYKSKDLLFSVFNRNGQKIFETRNWKDKWDGTFKGAPQGPGTYVWILHYTNIETGKTVDSKGSTVLIR